jgi:hypothetical protein
MFATVFAAALAVGVGGIALAQSTATPDTGSEIHGISTGNGRGRTGAGQGQSGTTRQDRADTGNASGQDNAAGPANTAKPTLSKHGQSAGTPPTGRTPAGGIQAQ